MLFLGIFYAKPPCPCFAHKENTMRIAIYILLILITVLMIICYSLCVIAHDADERAERMYRKWKEGQHENK